ncbi:MAG: hypothetical protein AAF645_07075 [Myxococcota bacterium]
MEHKPDEWQLRPIDEASEGLLDGEEGPAARLEDPSAMSAAILRAWEAEAAPPKRRGLSPGWSAAAGLLVGFFLAGSMAAALVYVMRESPAPAAPAPTIAPPTNAAPTPQLSVPDVPEPEPEDEAAEASVDEASTALPARARAPSTRDLLREANELRRTGAYGEAAALYRRVSERASPEAYSAAVAAGSLELEHLNRPARAARLFQRASRLRPQGRLDLTVRQGLATAYAATGQRARERQALERLVNRHPSSRAAVRARQRLLQLTE